MRKNFNELHNLRASLLKATDFAINNINENTSLTQPASNMIKEIKEKIKKSEKEFKAKTNDLDIHFSKKNETLILNGFHIEKITSFEHEDRLSLLKVLADKIHNLIAIQLKFYDIFNFIDDAKSEDLQFRFKDATISIASAYNTFNEINLLENYNKLYNSEYKTLSKKLTNSFKFDSKK